MLQRGTKSTTANTGFASGGVTCKLGALCFYSSSVLVDSFVLRNPPERKAPKRYCNELFIFAMVIGVNNLVIVLFITIKSQVDEINSTKM
jgi:hypothetical protein